MLTSDLEIVKYTKGFSTNLIVAAHMGAEIPLASESIEKLFHANFIVAADFSLRRNREILLTSESIKQLFQPSLLCRRTWLVVASITFHDLLPLGHTIYPIATKKCVLFSLQFKDTPRFVKTYFSIR